jgi:type IV secretion system protein VirB4
LSPELTPDLIDALRSTTSPMALLAGGAGIVAGGVLFAGLLTPAIAHAMLPSPRETKLADFLPFDQILPDGRTVICRDGTVVACLEVAGRDITFLTPGEREAFYYARKNWIDALAETGVMVRVFILRERIDPAAGLTHENIVLREIARRWEHSFQNTFRNRQIIVLSVAGKGKNPLAKLNDAIDITASILHPYRPQVLSQLDANPERRPLWIYTRLASPITRPEPAGIGPGVREAICADTVEFGKEEGTIQFRSGEKTLYCATMGLRSIGDFTNEGLVLELGAIPAEIAILHSFDPLSRTQAQLRLVQHQRMTLATRYSAGVHAQFHEAMNMVEGSDSNAATLSFYAMTVFIYAHTLEELQAIEAEVKRIAAGYGVTTVREGAATQASWFAQFPGYSLWPRVYKLFSNNVATHVTLDKPPEGLAKSDWGPGPIAMFRTAMGTAYNFQFHVTDEVAAVAHCVAIGPTGGGKTTLINFLTAMALRHPKLRAYMIDRHGGGYIFTNAIGGSYVTFEGSDLPGRKTELNPFYCSDTPENRTFLRGFLQAIADVDSSNADAVEEIGFAVEAAFDTLGFTKENRSLANIFDAVFSKAKGTRKQLQKWVDPAVYGKLFNGSVDSLDLTTTRLVTLDFTKIYEHEDLARAVILYLMHRIQAAITETRSPALIFIDETEPVVRHPMFRTFFLQMLQEYRKKGAAIISAFQRPEAIAQAGLGEAIRGQAQTTFFLPNPQAKEMEYADWGLTDREMDFIKGRLSVSRRLRRAVLVKRASGESVILDVDLSPLGPLLKIFRSDEPSKAEAEMCMRKFGADWLRQYLEIPT